MTGPDRSAPGTKSGKVSNIRVVDTRASAKAQVVDQAKRILEMAESGEIVDLSWAASKVNGEMISSFTQTDDQYRRLYAVSRLLHRLHLAADGTDI